MALRVVFRRFYTLIAVCWSANGAFVTHPSNVAVSTNHTSVFTCATDDTSSDRVLITWSYIAAGSTALPSTIAPLCNVRNTYKSIYHTESAAGVCSLIINSTQPANAGTYLCQDLQDSKDSTAELVVLEPLTSSVNAVENTASESDTVRYKCKVSAGSGRITASIRWTSGGVPITDNIARTTSVIPIISVYTVTAGTSNLPSCKCEVYFLGTNVSGPSGQDVIHVAQNTPTYSDSHSFTEIKVTYCPRNVTIPRVTSESTVAGGTVLHCSASGNPSPTFRWTNLTGDIDVTGSTFTVEPNKFYVLTCTAINTVTHSNGTRRTCSDSYTVTFNTTDVPPSTTQLTSTPGPTVKNDDIPSTFALSLVIGVLALIIIFTLIICCCCSCCPLYLKCSEKAGGAATGNTQPTTDNDTQATTVPYESLDFDIETPAIYEELETMRTKL